jgi:CheY-like chemotaxis protein
MDRVTGRILIVDDEPPLLRIMTLFLGRLGYSVTPVDSTIKAWELAEADPGAFAAAVLDGSMAGMSMEDLALRLLHANPALRVLACSGYPVDMTNLTAAAPDRVAFLLKPFTPDMLATAMRRLLAAQEESV